MANIIQPFLFGWKEIDAASDLDRLRLVLSVIPDEGLMRKLEKRRYKGRDDYPIRPTWNALLAGVVYQHISSASLLRELRRNGQLMRRTRHVCLFCCPSGKPVIQRSLPGQKRWQQTRATTLSLGSIHKLRDGDRGWKSAVPGPWRWVPTPVCRGQVGPAAVGNGAGRIVPWAWCLPLLPGGARLAHRWVYLPRLVGRRIGPAPGGRGSVTSGIRQTLGARSSS